MSREIDVELADARHRSHSRNSTNRLLTLLKMNHDYSVQAPEDHAKPAPVVTEAPTAPKIAIVEFDQRPVTVPDIQRAVARAFNVSRYDLIGPKRIKKFTVPRHVAAYLSTELTQRSLPDIGRRFGGRDHTTIMHSRGKVGMMMAADSSFAERVNSLREELTR